MSSSFFPLRSSIRMISSQAEPLPFISLYQDSSSRSRNPPPDTLSRSSKESGHSRDPPFPRHGYLFPHLRTLRLPVDPWNRLVRISCDRSLPGTYRSRSRWKCDQGSVLVVLPSSLGSVCSERGLLMPETTIDRSLRRPTRREEHEGRAAV